MFHVPSTIIKSSRDVTVHAIELGWLPIINSKTEVK